MKVVDGIKYLKIGEVAERIGKSTQTIKLWYAWMETKPSTDKKLPPVYHLDKRGSRWFKESDIPMLEEFAKNVQYGEMSKFTAQLWGERGKLIMERGNQRCKD